MSETAQELSSPANGWRAPASTRNINPSDTNDVVGEYAQANAAQTDAAIAAASAAFPAWSRTTPQERHDILLRVSTEILGATRGTRPAAGARGRQDAARGDRRSRPRRADLRLLRRRSAAHPRREVRQRAARRRRRGDARAGRRRRHHRAVEFPDRDSRLEDRAGARLRQLRGVQAGRPRARLGACARRNHRRAPALPEGVFNLVMGRGSVVGQAMLDHRHVDAITFTGSVATGTRGRRRLRRARCASSSWRWAARTRWSCSTTPISRVAVECAVNGAFFSTGQRCTASSRLIVTEGIYDRFADALAERMQGARRRRRAEAGNAYRPGRRPEPARSGSLLYRDRQGARAPSWRSAASGSTARRPASIMAPALFIDADNTMRIAREEIFGPVAAMIPAQGLRRTRWRSPTTPNSGSAPASARRASNTPRTSSATPKPAW